MDFKRPHSSGSNFKFDRKYPKQVIKEFIPFRPNTFKKSHHALDHLFNRRKLEVSKKFAVCPLTTPILAYILEQKNVPKKLF